MDRTAMLTSKLFLFFLYVSILSILVAGDEEYGKRGGEITLTPSLSGLLNRIVWKHGDDKAIEWEGGVTDAYRQFKGSTFLDTKTGEMKITKLDPKFDGVYSADVNGIQATKKWTLKVLDPVSKPIIDKDKECNEFKCKLSCESEATVKVQYAWRKGKEELQKYNRTLVLEKTDDKVGEAYICNCSNPVSFAVSDPVVPFPKPKPLVGIIVGLLFLIIIIISGVFAVIYRKELMAFMRTRCGTRAFNPVPTNGGKPPNSQ